MNSALHSESSKDTFFLSTSNTCMQLVEDPMETRIKMISVVVRYGPKGQERSTSIEVEQFPDLQTALEFLGLVGGDGKLTSYGNEYLVQAINSQHLSNRKRRKSASMSGSAEERLGHLAKNDPELRSKLNELLSDLDLRQIKV